jgi:hypothetical protein
LSALGVMTKAGNFFLLQSLREGHGVAFVADGRDLKCDVSVRGYILSHKSPQARRDPHFRG